LRSKLRKRRRRRRIGGEIERESQTNEEFKEIAV
jgi:hypothetical protein